MAEKSEKKKTSEENDKKTSAPNGVLVKAFIVVTAFLVVYFLVATRSAYIERDKALKEIAEIQQEIHEANAKRTELKKRYKIVDNFMDKMEKNGNDPIKAFGVLKKGAPYTETDSLVEETARKKLGYVKPNEIIYIDKNK